LSSDEPARMFGDNLSDDDKRRMVIRAYKNLKESFAEYSKPDGGKNSPAKTCKDLHTSFPEKKNGDYWIDPNGADPKDAILVYCDMENEATCVNAKPSMSQEISIVSEEKEMWLAEAEGAANFQINYKADSNQMSFLQLLSSKAEQEITYHCFNSIAYENMRGNFRKSASFMSWNDLEIKNRGKFKYEVLEDSCKSNRKSSWGKTVFRMEVQKPTRLPIVDVRVEDFSNPTHKIKIEVGQVCFS